MFDANQQYIHLISSNIDITKTIIHKCLTQINNIDEKNETDFKSQFIKKQVKIDKYSLSIFFTRTDFTLQFIKKTSKYR